MVRCRSTTVRLFGLLGLCTVAWFAHPSHKALAPTNTYQLIVIVAVLCDWWGQPSVVIIDRSRDPHGTGTECAIKLCNILPLSNTLKRTQDSHEVTPWAMQRSKHMQIVNALVW